MGTLLQFVQSLDQNGGELVLQVRNHPFCHLLRVEVDALAPVYQIHQRVNHPVRILCWKLEILGELLANRSDGLTGHALSAMSDKKCVLYYFPNVFFPWCFGQSIQYLPIHILKIYSNDESTHPRERFQNPLQLQRPGEIILHQLQQPNRQPQSLPLSHQHRLDQ